MNKTLFLTAAMMAVCTLCNAQTLAPDYKGSGNNNPISANIFCADPTALEYNGRLYVYGSNDHQQFVANGKKGENNYGEIKSIVVFSTDDMVNWTFHGTIDTKRLCSSWVTSPWWHAFGVSWAPSVTWRHNEENGKDEFFLYFCNSSHGVGVLTAESPIGPWKSPNKELMITYDTPGANAQGTNANFDPGVTIDDNGVGWISFGGLGPSTIMPNAARIIKLKPSMTEVDGTAAVIPAPYHFEANELNVIGGKYVYTYCSNWASRSETSADWNAYKTEHGISASAPNACTMCYMVSDNPLDPNSWEYKGVYGVNSSSNNNHSHLQKFQGQYYHLYHGAPLMLSMRDAGLLTEKDAFYRSICVNQATVNENTATVNPVTINLTGVTQIKDLNPYEWQQAETMASCGGIDYEDYTNIKRNTKKNSLNNEVSENLQVKMKEGSWINLRKVDYGTNGAAKFTLRAKGIGTIELRNGTSTKTTVATIVFSSTEMAEQTFDIPVGKMKGEKNNLYLVVTAANDFYVDAWKFTEEGGTSINNVKDGQVADTQIYDLSGRRLTSTDNRRGIVVEQYTDKQGVKRSRKVLSGK